MSDATCSVDDCDRLPQTRGWCNKHYIRWQRHGDPEYVRPKRSCVIAECGQPVRGHGYCNKHHLRLVRHGDPLAIDGRDLTPEQRFLRLADKGAPVPAYRPDLGPCWAWTGSKGDDDYGVFSTGGHSNVAYAHVWSYEHFVRPIPAGLEIDHLCRVRHCVNPAHLEPVTHAVNCRRGVEARRHLARTA